MVLIFRAQSGFGLAKSSGRGLTGARNPSSCRSLNSGRSMCAAFYV